MSASRVKSVALRQVALTGGLAFCAAALSSWMFRDSIVEFHTEIRGFLFSGYLTLGSFLLTTKTFVITRLQEGLFQTQVYFDRHKTAIDQHGEKKVGERNEPLRRLTEYLVWSVSTCLSTAVIQLLLSACKNPYASIFALSLAFAGLMLVTRSWLLIRQFIHEYLEIANLAPPKS